MHYLNKLFFLGAVLVFSTNKNTILAQNVNQLRVVSNYEKGAFPIVHNGKPATILVDAKDAEVVSIAAHAVSSDIASITGNAPKISSKIQKDEYLIIAGTIGQSRFIDSLIKSGTINVSQVRGKWESNLITIIPASNNSKTALVVAGSDRRGTAYGLFEISKRAGVSPWIYWADVKPEKRKSLYITPGSWVQREPSVKYRGIFINDEDWGLHSWASKNIDKDIKDIGPKTYAKVFELMLRLKANTIWPAMHDSTKAFWYYPNNPVTADRYGIVMGSTHCDMMLRSNTFEWQKNFKNEYGTEPGPFRYDSNKEEVSKYWEDRVKAARNYESMYTIGMRGVRDGSMSGPKNREGKIALMDTIMRDQRDMLSRNIKNSKNAVQIFCPYKEVLDLYKGGLEVPDDATLVWTDDNFGYIRQLSDSKEQQRKGASGVYYHLSYLGGPHDYLWLSSISPALISIEMSKAYQFGADRFWVVNVGDIKPAEMEIQFFMDLAWDVDRWNPTRAAGYTQFWAKQTFGETLSRPIGAIKAEYLRLAQSGKPEHLGILKYDDYTREQRLKDYERLLDDLNNVKTKVPQRLQSAFFQLVEYPVKAAAKMNEKIFYAQLSLEKVKSDVQLATQYSNLSYQAYHTIKDLTAYYNSEIEDGKWNGIITYKPRNLKVYGMPDVAVPVTEDPTEIPVYDRRYLDTTSVKSNLNPGELSLNSSAFSAIGNEGKDSLKVIRGLGVDDSSITRYPFTGPSYTESLYHKSPFAVYKVSLKKGIYQLALTFTPNRAINKERNLKVAVSMDDEQPVFLEVDIKREGSEWGANVVRGYRRMIIPLDVKTTGNHSLKIFFLDTGVALNRIDFHNSSSLDK